MASIVVVAAACPHGEAGQQQPATIIDPFMGSGATCVAALKLGRNFIGVELNEQYLKDSMRIRLQPYLN